MKSCRTLLLVVVACFVASVDVSAQDDSGKTPAEDNLEQRRMDLMRDRALAILVTSKTEGVPRRLQREPLFRYDDVPRGYVDGAVWRLGEKGRPLAIVTTELHPRYLGSGSRIVYDFLSLRSDLR